MAIESKLRQYYWLQFDYFRDINMKFNDSPAALDSVTTASVKRWDVASKRDSYRFGRFAVVRAAWQKESELLVNEIYAANQPTTHVVEIKKLAE